MFHEPYLYYPVSRWSTNRLIYIDFWVIARSMECADSDRPFRVKYVVSFERSDNSRLDTHPKDRELNHRPAGM